METTTPARLKHTTRCVVIVVMEIYSNGIFTNDLLKKYGIFINID